MKLWRTVGTGASAVALLALAACGTSDADNGSGGKSGGDSGKSDSNGMSSSKEMSANNGKTTADDVYGSACDQVPDSGSGSVKGMMDDPVATAASNNPLLTKLDASVKATGLADTLNNADGITVFAPYDKAFKELGKDKVQTLLNDKTDKLASVLKYHVVPKRLDADDLSSMDSVKTMNGDKLTLKGSGKDVTVNGNKVLCGNIPTANATVFVIDKVMMPSRS